MEQTQLSIIIPAYNAESTLAQCIDSIIEQDYADWIIYLIDDGSTDNTASIADNYAQKDERIKALHKENGGLSDARNYGIEAMLNESPTPYITFIDSDDYLAPRSLNILMCTLYIHPKFDILEYSALLFKGGKKEHQLSLHDKVYENAMRYWLEGQAYEHSYAWNKIYKTSIFSDGLRFPKGKLFEDSWTLPYIIKKCKNIATTSAGKYIYQYNENGITKKADSDVNQFRQLLEGQLEALRTLGIDLFKKPQLSKEEARLYLKLTNQQITLKRLDSNFPTLIPKRRIPLSTANNFREWLKIIYLNLFTK